jgi:hypothetical protein
MVEPTSSDSTKCCLICNMDLNAIVPQSLLNMIMRKVTGLITIFLEKEVRRMQEDPDNSEHAKLVTSDTFYTEQLTNKMDRFLAALPEDSPLHNPKPKKVTPPPRRGYRNPIGLPTYNPTFFSCLPRVLLLITVVPLC